MNHASRIHRLIGELDEPLLITSLVNIRYLTGFTGSNAFLYVTGERCVFVTDGRYAEIAEGLLADIDGVDLEVYRNGLYGRLASLFGSAPKVQLEGSHITWDAQRSLAAAFEGELTVSTGVVEAHRGVKDVDEIEALRAAARAGDRAFDQILDLAANSATELELAEGLIDTMERAGARRAGWPPIVAVGSNASRPHHESGTNSVADGLLLADYGCVVGGYHSDMTRTIYRGGAADAETRRVHRAVLEANEAGIAAVGPGVTCGAVDHACRAVLADYGYEKDFLHSTGHGVGLGIHEAPSVRAGSEEVLEPGNVITVEPGVYLPGRLGVRIEDMVLVTEDGHEVLTKSTKDMEIQEMNKEMASR